MYKSIFNEKLNLKNPKTFNEKLQWLKLYDKKDNYTRMVDKYEVKKYVADIIGSEYIIPTIGIYDSWKDIDFNKRSISVNHSATYYTRNGKASFGISKPKTEAGIRHIPMMDTVYNALKNEYDRQKRDGFCAYESLAILAS
jgi:hypothetical protein